MYTMQIVPLLCLPLLAGYKLQQWFDWFLHGVRFAAIVSDNIIDSYVHFL